MKKTAKLASERLKNVILSDKVSHPDRLNDLLKSDVNDMLKTYFELYPGSIKVCLKPSEYGLDILIDATASGPITSSTRRSNRFISSPLLKMS